MSDLGFINYYLGMKVTRNQINRTFILSQIVYVDKVFEDLSMVNLHAVKVLMNLGCKLEFDLPGYDAIPEFRQFYQLVVGSLIYLMLCTQPDISFAISSVSSYAANPTEMHWKAVKHIL